MKNQQLITALQKLDPNATVLINIKQRNKSHGVLQLEIESTQERSGYESWVDGSYSGCTLTVHLPEGAHITQKKK